MDAKTIAELLEKIKIYCPHTSNWKVYDTNISYTEHGKETVIMLGGKTPEQYLQEMLDRISPSAEGMYAILSEPISPTSDKLIAEHDTHIRLFMIKQALAKKQITPEQSKELLQKVKTWIQDIN
jgi:hypothetical protein